MEENHVETKKAFYKKGWFIFGIIAIILAIVVGIILLTNGNKTKSDSNGTLVVNGNTGGSNIKEANTFDELENIVLADVESLINNLNIEKEQLITDINSYEKYKNNGDKVENFYKKILLTTQNLGIKMREYSIVYAEFIIASNKTNGEKYDDLEEIYDTLYEDFADEIYDEIYEDLLEDMYDSFYSGIIEDAYNDIKYGEYSDARSNAYDWYSDTRSDVYDEYSDARSDIYDFYSDIRSEIYNDDIEDANKEIKKFKEDIEKIKNTNNTTTENTTEISTIFQEQSNEENTTSNLVDGISPNFKEAMDSYESFMNEYIEFMKQYNANPTDSTLLLQYTTMLQKYSEQISAFDKWKSEDMTTQEAAYYVDVQARVTKKLLEV